MKLKLISLLFAFSLASAQEKSSGDSIKELDALTIESTPIESVTQTWSSLSGDELDKAKGLTIADSLSNIPGVSQTTFGPTANCPVIRGADKFRLRVLQNGTDTFDVSAQSEDHAVPIDPLMVDRIEAIAGIFLPLVWGWCNWRSG